MCGCFTSCKNCPTNHHRFSYMKKIQGVREAEGVIKLDKNIYAILS